MRPALLCFCFACLIHTARLAAQTPSAGPVSSLRASALPVVPAGTNLSDPDTLLRVAAEVNNLDRPGRAPWHLKAAFESFNAKGASSGKGTYEEWRLAPDTWKRVYVSDKYAQTEYHTASGRLFESKSGPAPWPLSLIADEIGHPVPDSFQTSSKAELRKQRNGQMELSCDLVGTPLKKAAWPFGLIPTYCFKADSPMLRVSILDGHIQVLRNEIAAFRGTYFAKSVALSTDRAPLLNISVQSLESMSDAETASIAFPEKAKDRTLERIGVASGVAAGMKIEGSNPTYPILAGSNGLQGLVVLDVVIGADGHVHSVSLDSAPDDLLAISAISSVQRWVYRPYLLNGEPVSVKTKVNVVYRREE